MSPKIESKICSRSKIKDLSHSLKAQGKRLVFTNGVFDILHAGHVNYLADAASLGDFLIVGINSDDSVKRLGKSPARPLQSQLSRCAVMASLEWVNAVVVFDEDTPEVLINEILPDVLVKGSDYEIEKIAGYQAVIANGGVVKTIALLEGFSTTAIEKKILSENQ
jgi:D-glycero-beta-D-manno-heptose 1-phosphate adenylyltransferase